MKYSENGMPFANVLLLKSSDSTLVKGTIALEDGTFKATFEGHRQGIVNAFKTQTDSGKHENLNGGIQSVLARARGFLNFDRFRINVLFYFGKLNLTPLKI